LLLFARWLIFFPFETGKFFFSVCLNFFLLSSLLLSGGLGGILTLLSAGQTLTQEASGAHVLLEELVRRLLSLLLGDLAS